MRPSTDDWWPSYKLKMDLRHIGITEAVIVQAANLYKSISDKPSDSDFLRSCFWQEMTSSSLIPVDWLPSEGVMGKLKNKGVPLEFVEWMVPEFVMRSRENGEIIIFRDMAFAAYVLSRMASINIEGVSKSTGARFIADGYSMHDINRGVNRLNGLGFEVNETSLRVVLE